MCDHFILCHTWELRLRLKNFAIFFHIHIKMNGSVCRVCVSGVCTDGYHEQRIEYTHRVQLPAERRYGDVWMCLCVCVRRTECNYATHKPTEDLCAQKPNSAAYDESKKIKRKWKHMRAVSDQEVFYKIHMQ